MEGERVSLVVPAADLANHQNTPNAVYAFSAQRDCFELTSLRVRQLLHCVFNLAGHWLFMRVCKIIAGARAYVRYTLLGVRTVTLSVCRYYFIEVNY